LFEAAGCGTAIISDQWEGLQTFFTAGKEILLPQSCQDVVSYLAEMDEQEIRQIGRNAQQRVMAKHSSERRAIQFEQQVNRVTSGRREVLAEPAV